MASARRRLLGSEPPPSPRTQEGKAAVSRGPGHRRLGMCSDFGLSASPQGMGPTHTESTCVARASDTQPVIHATLRVTVCMKWAPSEPAGCGITRAPQVSKFAPFQVFGFGLHNLYPNSFSCSDTCGVSCTCTSSLPGPSHHVTAAWLREDPGAQGRSRLSRGEEEPSSPTPRPGAPPWGP